MGKLKKNQKSSLTIGVITLAAGIVLAGISFRQSESPGEDEQEAVIMAESEWTEDAEDGSGDTDTSDAEEDGGEETALSGTGDDCDAASGESTADDTDVLTAGSDAVSPAETDATGTADADTQETAVITGTTKAAETMAEALSFSESDTLCWPVQGDILINYSMDESVYFATLDQYKYNPALVIRSDVNTQVFAAAAGQVISIETASETGETVTMDIGNGYQLIYAQLKELQVAEGDFVEEGSLIGYISEPTKYYSVEGSNLYFAMVKDGTPVNPLNYLE